MWIVYPYFYMDLGLRGEVNKLGKGRSLEKKIEANQKEIVYHAKIRLAIRKERGKLASRKPI